MTRVALSLLLLCSCKPLAFDLSGRACDAQGACADGYECLPGENVCVPKVARACDQGSRAACWRTADTGHACPALGAYLPCGPRRDCSLGCRRCEETGWSECSAQPCAIGQPAHCGGCGDDCATTVAHAEPVCVPSGAGFSCNYLDCDRGYVDADGDRANGCEATCAFDPTVPERCDGVDNNCSGEVDDIGAEEVDTVCGQQHGLAEGVAGWRCQGGRCLISDCAPGAVDLDGRADTGCEYGCVRSGPELCDGVDNDCDGLVDGDDPDLSSQAAINLTCDTQHPAAAHVAAWTCSAGACAAAMCAPAHWDLDRAAANGCEYACEPSGRAELCDGLDNDCDGLTDAADPDLATPGQQNATCGAQLDAAAGVRQWECTPSGCQVAECADGQHDVDGQATTGCEYTCTPTQPPDERCDGLDNDCDGITDPANASGCARFYRDSDGDGFGRSLDSRCLCQAEAPYTATSFGDCDDVASGCGLACHPGSTEVCDGWDNDCDPRTPEVCEPVFEPALNSDNSPLNDDHISAIAVAEDGTLWIVTAQGETAFGLSLDRGSARWTEAGNLRPDPVTRLVAGDGNLLWVGYRQDRCDQDAGDPCECGPSRFRSDDAEVTHLCTDFMSGESNAVLSIAPVPGSGDAFLGAEDDFARFIAASGKTECDVELGTGPQSRCQAMVSPAGASEPTVFLGTAEALHRCVMGTSPTKRCRATCLVVDVFPEGPDGIAGLSLSHDAGLWVASDGLGVARLDARTLGAPTRFNVSNGRLPSNRVRAVATWPASDLTFVATASGLAVLDRKAGTSTFYRRTDGLPSDEVTSLAVDTARQLLWVGTAAGLTALPWPLP